MAENEAPSTASDDFFKEEGAEEQVAPAAEESTPDTSPQEEAAESQTGSGPQEEAPVETAGDKPDFEKRYNDMRKEFDQRGAELNTLRQTAELQKATIDNLQVEDAPAVESTDVRVQKLVEKGYKEEQARQLIDLNEILSEPQRQAGQEQARIQRTERDYAELIAALKEQGKDIKDFEAGMAEILRANPTIKYVEKPASTLYGLYVAQNRQTIMSEMQEQATKKALEKLKESGAAPNIPGGKSAPNEEKQIAKEDKDRAELFGESIEGNEAIFNSEGGVK